MNNPRCPITGNPPVRLVQWLESDFLVLMWRIIFKSDASPSLNEHQRIGLWESPTGLYFFYPLLEGDDEFYKQFYAFAIDRKLWSKDSIREAFLLAARRIAPGTRVLDVGCGWANFRNVIPNAEYVGLDPNFGGVANVRDETLEHHLQENSENYDTVCAFEVLEHLASPVQMFADMVRAARPGGQVIVSVPHVPSALTRIPNNIMNAPPHHLTWWTEPALQALAERCGATVESIENADWNAEDAILYWMARCSPIRCYDIHFRAAWSWYAASVFGFLAARLMSSVINVPKKTDEGGALVMTARRKVSALTGRVGKGAH
jgi:SAM-dependent methyltransferase